MGTFADFQGTGGRSTQSAVLLTSPAVRKYIINYGRPFIFSTSLSHSTVCALNASFDYIESAAGDEVRLVPHTYGHDSGP